MHDESSTISERSSSSPASSRARAGVPAVVRFADFEFDFERDQLRRGGTPIPLSPKPSALLRYLLANPQRLIAKAELMEGLWGDVVVTDDSLVQCVGELRHRMGVQGPTLITTHPRRGYMFEADVRPVGPGAPERDATTSPATAAQVALPGPKVPPRARWRIGRRRGIALAFALAAAVVGAGAAFHFLHQPTPYRIDAELARRYAIVVMPFQDIGSTPAPTLMREGLADELAAQLAQRQDTLVMRGAEPADARYAMSGSFALRGTGVAIHVHVKSLADGRLVWAEHYDYPDASDPDINLDVALRASSGLRLRYAELHRARVSVPGYRFDPVDLVMSGWDDIDRRQTAQDVSRGRARFEEALRVDPHSVKALTGLGAALMSERFGYSGEAAPRDVTESERVSAEAISIAPNNSVALINWANVLLFRGQPELALPFFEKAMLSAPSNANAHVRYGFGLLSMGRTLEAQRQIDITLRIGHRDPRVTASAWSLASLVAFTQGNDEKAYALSQRALAERPTYGLAYATMASIDALHGRSDAAQRNMAEHLRLIPRSTATRYFVNTPAGAQNFLAARNRLVEGMRMAGLPE